VIASAALFFTACAWRGPNRGGETFRPSLLETSHACHASRGTLGRVCYRRRLTVEDRRHRGATNLSFVLDVGVWDPNPKAYGPLQPHFLQGYRVALWPRVRPLAGSRAQAPSLLHHHGSAPQGISDGTTKKRKGSTGARDVAERN
jgi:hypothetical protein